MKLLAILLTVGGSLSSIFGLFPVIFVYPTKHWDTTSDYWNHVFFQAPDRLFWQIGLIILIIGLILLYKTKKR